VEAAWSGGALPAFTPAFSINLTQRLKGWFVLPVKTNALLPAARPGCTADHDIRGQHGPGAGARSREGHQALGRWRPKVIAGKTPERQQQPRSGQVAGPEAGATTVARPRILDMLFDKQHSRKSDAGRRLKGEQNGEQNGLQTVEIEGEAQTVKSRNLAIHKGIRRW
jgi:hypothetical protein